MVCRIVSLIDVVLTYFRVLGEYEELDSIFDTLCSRTQSLASMYIFSLDVWNAVRGQKCLVILATSADTHEMCSNASPAAISEGSDTSSMCRFWDCDITSHEHYQTVEMIHREDSIAGLKVRAY